MSRDAQIMIIKKEDKYRAVLPTEIISPIARPAIAPPDPEVKENDWIRWGSRDDFPTKARKKIGKVSIAGRTIRNVAAKMQGNGIVYYKSDDVRAGKIIRHYDPDIEDFLRNSRINTEWFPAQIADYCYYINTFGSYILSNDKSKIAQIVHRPAELCRVKYNDSITEKTHVVFSPYFPDSGPSTPNQRVDIPIMPMTSWGSRYAMDRNKSAKEFSYHTYYPTPGSWYYGVPWWDALFQEDGWLTVSANVPRIILSMHNNQVSLKYLIYIPESYFAARYENWQTMDDEEARNIIDAKIEEINQHLTGTDNVSKSIAQTFKEDPVTHAAYGKIVIEAIDDKLKRDSWVPDAHMSDAQIVQGFGEHPSQIGLQPEGGKMGAGSGSDQRESFNTSITLNTPDQMILLEPLNFISWFNGWGVEFYVDHTYHTTTNNQESGLVPGEGSKM